ALARGAYDPSHEFLLFGRSFQGLPGSHVLTPLLLPDGRALVVDRGWVPIEVDDPADLPAAGAEAPPGRVEVEGILLPPGSDEPAPGPRMEEVSLRAVAARVPYPVLPVYLELRSQDPPPGELPRPAPPPELTEGPHLSYAVQWFLFAGVAVAVYGALVRRELRAGSAPRPGEGAPARAGRSAGVDQASGGAG
ncbi:MAG TPA: SURF1 family protein, partial [Actinomycetota bacterium]|nr:SURF1 family protein [Actinomycetota bacterium]